MPGGWNSEGTGRVPTARLDPSEGLCPISGADSGTPMWYWRVHICNSRVTKLRQEERCMRHAWAKYYKILFQKTTKKFFKVMTALGLSWQFLEKYLLYMIWPLEVEKEKVKLHVLKHTCPQTNTEAFTWYLSAPTPWLNLKMITRNERTQTTERIPCMVPL